MTEKTKPSARPPSLEDRARQAQDWAACANRPISDQIIPSHTTPTDYPWLSAHPKVIHQFQLRLTQSRAEKLKWLAEREPNASMHKLVVQAIDDYLAAMSRKHGVNLEE